MIRGTGASIGEISVGEIGWVKEFETERRLVSFFNYYFLIILVFKEGFVCDLKS